MLLRDPNLERGHCHLLLLRMLLQKGAQQRAIDDIETDERSNAHSVLTLTSAISSPLAAM